MSSTGSSNPLIVELSRLELVSDAGKQLKILRCVKTHLHNNLIDAGDVISPLVKLVASNNADVKVV